MLGIVTEHLNHLLAKNKIKDVKMGYSWRVSTPSLAKYMRTKSPGGRPVRKNQTLLNAHHILRERPQIGDKATAYVCVHFACQMPVTEAEGLAAQMLD